MILNNAKEVRDATAADWIVRFKDETVEAVESLKKF